MARRTQLKKSQVIEKIQFALDNFTSQFEIAALPHAKGNAEPQITTTPEYTENVLWSMEDRSKAKRPAADSRAYDMVDGYDVSVAIKGPQAQECARLMQDALEPTTFQTVSLGLNAKKPREAMVRFEVEADRLEERLDRFDHYSRALFDYSQEFQRVFHTEQELRRLRKGKPAEAVSTTIEKSFYNDDDIVKLALSYQTSDAQLMEYALKLGASVQLRSPQAQGGFTHEIVMLIAAPGTDEPSCNALMDAIEASVQRASAVTEGEARGVEARGSHTQAAAARAAARRSK